MKKHILKTTVFATYLAFIPVASAELVPIKWTDGQFSYKATIGPKKFVEICGPLKKFQVIDWRFSASGATDFNIHYHVGKEVIAPVDKKNVDAAEGVTNIGLDQDYCWMWSNKSDRVVNLDVVLGQAS